jgi:hypothetical protein
LKEIAPLHFSDARRRFQLDVSTYAKEPANGGGWGNPGGRIGSPRAENCVGLIIGGGCGNPGGRIGSPRAENCAALVIGGGWGNPGGRIGSPRAENCAGLVIGGGCGNPGGSIGSPRAEKLEGTADPVVCATGRQARTEAVIKMVQARNVVMKNLFIVVPFLCGWL